MTTVKKIILFLFGIVLIVFGNKAAIDTMFKSKDALKVPESEEKELANKEPIITEEIESNKTETVIEKNIIPAPKTQEKKVVETAKKDTLKASKAKPTEQTVKEQPAKVSEKKEEQKVAEAPKTTIEPVKEEKAAPSE